MELVEKFVEFISKYEFGLKYLEIVSNLTQVQIEIIVLITLILFLFILYRKFGASIFWVSLFIIFIGFIVYRANIGDFYKNRNTVHDQHMNEIQKEIDKDMLKD